MSDARLTWFKSSYSDSGGGNCVEVALEWRKSSYSDDEGGACVEVAEDTARVHIRDSKAEPNGPRLEIAPAAWAAFVAYAAVGG
ncbi:DUF397 domain-containing protein [Streptomyces purpurogeneiscleroticus]|uniref:DUF397 domain-containing protein n=1 Tax=Streptomyces purpurogeneiscleroticus TaxID=68259 RepID=UPI001CBF50D1|nr:DUF397 domain-containing protein [Streptomyces purpurogeneiscleroticus]MBZ4020354.1 DUF397 domain-containing protein [Streptomyces purpurogeneiscleroticus]